MSLTTEEEFVELAPDTAVVSVMDTDGEISLLACLSALVIQSFPLQLLKSVLKETRTEGVSQTRSSMLQLLFWEAHCHKRLSSGSTQWTPTRDVRDPI